MSVLDLERRTFEEIRDGLLAKARGQWVLIKGTEVRGFFPSEDAGVSEGVSLFGPDEPFFVQRVETVEEEVGAFTGVVRSKR